MNIQYRSATEQEQATLQCNTLQTNKMQCIHLVTKIFTASPIPTEIELVNIQTGTGKFALCAAHSSILLSRLGTSEGNSIVDLDEPADVV